MQLFNALPTVEVRGLRDFVRSRAHNPRADVERLADHLLRQRMSRVPELRREAVWAALFPGTGYQDTNMRLLMSRTLDLLEQYLAWREYKKDRLQQGIYLARAFRNLGMEERFRGAVGAARTYIEEAPLRNIAYLRDHFLLEFEWYDYFGGQKRTGEGGLPAVSNALDAWFFAEKLRWVCGQITLQTVARKALPDAEIGWMEEYLARHPALLDNTAVALWFACLKALTSEDAEPWYRRFRTLLDENRRAFAGPELRDLYMLCLNFYIRKWNQDGERRFAEVGFQLYREGFEAGWLLVDGVLSHFTFINAVALALRVGQFEWASRVIESHQSHLDPKFRYNTSVFCLARLHYEKGDTAASMRLLAEYTPDDPYHFMIAKILLMKIYFEQEEHDALDSLLDTMRKFLSRNKAVLGYQRDYFERIVHIALRLRQHVPGDKNDLAEIQAEIEGVGVLSDREWLLGRLGG